MPKTLSSQQAKPALSPWSKGGIGLGLGALALVVIGLVFPTGGAFFPLVSLWCSCVLFYGALWVLRVAHVELNFFHRAVLVGLWAAAVLYFYWALGRRQFIYAWDYVNYIVKQYSAETAFAQGPAAGFAYIFGSFADDYTNFITLFTEFPFCLSRKTGDDYAFCQVFSVLPSLLVLLAGLVVKVGQILNVKNRTYYFLFGMTLTAAYPFLRMSAVLAQPDWFGLIFAFAILLLTLDLRFDKLEPVRFGLIFLATAAIILARRWFLYFVVGYYFAYALLLIAGCVRLAKGGEKNAALVRVKNLVHFRLASVVAMVILLWPMVHHILTYNYAGRYSYYNGGGLALEAFYHIGRMGLFNILLMVLGLAFAAKHRAPSLPCLAGCELVVSILLFTRVQNTGSHQFLLFLPGYFILFLMYAEIIFLYYFDDLTGAIWTAIVFCLVTWIGSLIATHLPVIWYGAGVIAGAFAGWSVAYARLRWVEKNMDRHVFCRGNLIPQGKGKRPSGMVYERKAEQEQKEEA